MYICKYCKDIKRICRFALAKCSILLMLMLNKYCIILSNVIISLISLFFIQNDSIENNVQKKLGKIVVYDYVKGLDGA